MKKLSDQKGFSLIEVAIVVALGSIIVLMVGFGVFRFRDTFEYDLLVNGIIETVDFAKAKAVSSELDSQGLRSSYSVRFFEYRYVEFEGDIYVEGANMNVEHALPIGYRLTSSCLHVEDGTVTFIPIEGTNTNSCHINIFQVGNPSPVGIVSIDKYGVVSLT